MSPLMVSAQFAAFLWFTSRPENEGRGHAEAMKFARENGEYFLPVAHAGLGRLLLAMAAAPRRRGCPTAACAAPLPSPAPVSPLPELAVGPPFSCN